MPKQKITIGSILEININNQYYSYAQILKNSSVVFFDYKTTNKLGDFSNLEKAPILFILAVYNHVITRGRWKKVSKLKIREDCIVLPMKYIKDEISSSKYELYNPNTGEIIPSSKEECNGLERAAVWDAEHVESRILDFYNGVPNIWVEQIRN